MERETATLSDREVAFGAARPVLVSACLAGERCTHRGTDNAAAAGDAVAKVVAEGRAVLACPEADGGLPTPRPAAEIVGGDGHDVLDGRARVVTRGGEDVTEAYLRGAQVALDRAVAAGARVAVLKARSPSCGCGAVYDGTFAQTLRAGDGVTAALLQRHGIRVVTEEQADTRVV